MDSPDSQPSPLHTPPDSPTQSRRNVDSAGQQSKRHRSLKDLRDRAFQGSPSTKELAKLLLYEEKEAQELRNTIQLLSERLKYEAQRAEDAESQVREALVRFKDANDARLAAQAESTRYREELNLYKLQLENAQSELRRAQTLIDTIEGQRVAAEEDAAKARGMARKLKEEKVMQVAREEGRRQGIEEGIARGRAIGYEEGRAAGYARGRSSATKEYMEKAERYPRGDYEMPASQQVRVSMTSSNESLPTKQMASQAENIHIAPPASADPPARPLSSGQPPVPNANPRSSVHSLITPDYPQDDGWIPKVDEDGRVRLPPPHELATSPTHSPPPPPNQTPALMVPPPLPQPAHEDDLTTPTETSASRPGKPRRRRSLESNSTTMSQFDLLGPPVASSARVSERPQVLSAIVEEKERSSTISSPANHSHSNSPYAYASSPASAAQPTPSRPMPSPQPIPAPPPPAENYYVRPRSASSSESGGIAPDRVSTTPPDRTGSRSTQSLKGSIASNAGFYISVEPPSRPDSHLSGIQQEPGLLTPEHAARSPLPPLSNEDLSTTALPVQPPSIVAPQPSGRGSLSALGLPLQLPAGGQLPPGFVPAGPTHPTTPLRVPVTSSSSSSSSSSSYTPSVIPNLGGIYTNPNTPAAIPLPPSVVPSVHRLYYTPSVAGSHRIPSNEPVVIPPPSGHMPHVGIAGATPSLNATMSMGPPQPDRYNRSALQESTDSSSEDHQLSSQDDETASNSSTNTLSTPPPRRRTLRSTSDRVPTTPMYATAPTPPGVSYSLPTFSGSTSAPVVPPTPMSMVSGMGAGGTMRATKVPLPASTVGALSPTRSTLSIGTGAGSNSISSRAAKVPLPPSTVGVNTPQSVYTRLSRKPGSVSGSAVGKG